MFHCVWDIYSVLGCVFHPGVGGGLKVEGNSKEGRIETTRTKNIGGIKYRGVFFVVRGSAVWKFQHYRFPLLCVIFVSP